MTEAAHAQRQQQEQVAERAPATEDGPEFTPAQRSLLYLQRTAGNRAVAGMIAAAKADPPEFGPAEQALHAGQVTWGKHPQFPAVTGQTYYARKDIEQWPAFNLEVSRSLFPFGWKATPKRTDAAAAVWPANATPENEEGYKMPQEHPQHPGRDLYIRVSGQAANKIAGAEQQHLDDLDQGWAITGAAAAKAINQAAGEDADVRDEPVAAKKAAVNKVAGKMGDLGTRIRGALEGGGRLEDALGPMMDNAFTQSKTQRDDTGKHKLGVRYVMDDPERKRVLYEVDEDAQMDSASSDSVVNLGTIG